MPKVDNQENLRVNLDFKSISIHKTKAVETIMVMKKKMVKMNVKKIRLMLTPGPRL
jgi:hypothetical protein